MLNYAICEISGKQYKVIPGKSFQIDFQGESDKDIEANVLLLAQDGKVEIGEPYLTERDFKEKITLKRLENTHGKKIRVSKFHAKANYRKTFGSRARFTKVVLTA